MAEFFPDQYKTQKTCDKTVDNYSHGSEFIPECYKTQKMCDKAVDAYPSTIRYVTDWF